MKHMYISIIGIIMSIHTIVWASEQSSINNKIIFATTPWEEPELLKEIHAPLMEYLSNTLEKKAEFHIAKSYEELGQRIIDKVVDVGFFSPNAYVQAKRRNPSLKYLVTVQKKTKSGKLTDYYKGVILSLKSASIHSFKDLKGKRFGFTNYQSTSGYVYPMVLFKKKNIVPQTYFSDVFMLKKHQKVIGALIRGSIDGGATAIDHYTNATQKHGDVFYVIAETPPIPYDAYTAGAHVSDEDCNAIQNALIELTFKSAVIKKMGKSKYGPQGFILRDDHFYDVVREANPE